MSTAPAGPLNVFISYAHEDDRLCRQLLKHLSQLQREGVQGWYDRRLTGGTEWAGEIDQHLNTADIVLLLISPDFMASRYCYDVEMERALDGIHQLWKRAEKVGVPGNREYNPGWHTAMDLTNLLTVSEAITLAGYERKESRGAHFRDDYPLKDEAFGTFNIIVRKGRDGSMQISREPLVPLAPELKQIIEEMQ